MSSEEDVGEGGARAPPGTRTAQIRVSPDQSDRQKARRLLAGNCQSTEIVSNSVCSRTTPNAHHFIWGEGIRTGPREGLKAIDNGFLGGCWEHRNPGS